MSPPYMPLYVADYLSATSHLNAAESGAYLHLLMHYWQKGALPPEDKFLARIARMTDRQWVAAKPAIQAFFTDGWVNSRLESERAKALAKAEARAEYGSLGGRAKALNEKDRALAKAKAELAISQKQKAGEALAFSQGLETTTVVSDCVSDETLVPEPGSETLRAVGEGRVRKAKAEQRRAEVDLFQDVVAEWNALAEAFALPAVKDITEARQSAIRARGVDLVKTYDFPDARAGFRDLFARIRASPFLTGKARDFKCDFEFATRLSSFTKIMEGNYEARKAQQHR